MPDHRLAVIDGASGLTDERAAARIANELGALVEGEVRFGTHDRMLYATDASIYQVPPIGVVVPMTIDDAARVVEYCAAQRLPILPRGGGTSLAGQVVNAAVVIDFSAHCRRVLEIDAERRIARVEPGLVLDDFNAALAKHGLAFGPDVATSTHANLGGMIGNNSAGAHSILYGRTVEHLLGLDVALADGSRRTFEEGAAERDRDVGALTRRVAEVVKSLEARIDERFPKTVRHVDGYNLDLVLEQIRRSSPGTLDKVNLAHLFCGSEGTLGVTLGATVRLVEAPRTKGLAIVAFADVDAALEAVGTILETGPAAVELLDDVIIDVARDNAEYRRYVELLPRTNGALPGAVLYVEYYADDDEALHDRFDTLASRFSGHGIQRHVDADAMQRAWKLRKGGEPLLYGLPGARKPLTFIEDTAVDPGRLPEFVRRFRALVAGHGSTAAYYAHASVGCLHIRPMIDLRDAKDIDAMKAIAAEATDLVREFGGALSGEHGDGRLRSHLLERFYGPEICDGFRRIKAIFDPEQRLNPGNLVAPPPMEASLRVRPRERYVDVPDTETFFRYTHEKGFRGAVEMCNGAGMCRKTSGGTMCPSYRATRDERHATRGRGNALRLAITGQFSSDGRSPAWNDADTLETLSLCLACKACKSECPSNVDVARLKSEYLAQGYAQVGRVPFQKRFFGRVRRINALGSRLAPLANFFNRFPLTRAMTNALLGFDSRRSLPEFGTSLYKWFEKRGGSRAASEAPAVILFPDCFAVYNEPHIGRAAVEVLEALGYRVVLPKLGCCGRAMITMGVLREACATATGTARDLLACLQDENAIAIVGCEPSCISAIKDDWLDLKLDVEPGALQRLADGAWLVEEFIARQWDEHPNAGELQLRAPDECDVLLHGHCHQKALWGLDEPTSILRRLAGERLTVLDSGCCGLAGSFGYLPENYDLSMTVFEQSLGESLRQRPEAEVLATGTSCRHQIRDVTGRRARHPVELIARLIGA